MWKGEDFYNLMHLLLNYNVSGYVQSVFKLYYKGGGGVWGSSPRKFLQNKVQN